MAQILPPRRPFLPLAPTEYERAYQDQLNNVLRLYFSKIDTTFQQLLLGFNNYGTFYDTTTQDNPVANTENLMEFNTTAEAYGIEVEGTPPTQIKVSKGGVYNFQFSAQLDHSGGGAVSFYIWFKVNGTALPYTATKVVVDGPNAETVAAWNYLVTMDAGDYFELAWSADDTSAVVLAAAASSPVPAIPSVIMTVTYVYPNGTT
jgi:hypothetical protein